MISATNTRWGEDIQSVGLQRQAIEPIGESKSDYEIVLEIAKKLGLYEEVSEGKTVEEWIKYIFDVRLNCQSILAGKNSRKRVTILFQPPRIGKKTRLA